jgi:outer membrane protein OmpA-like peptidoglycan-associated protein/tetratricopeptide (TPR) repeat protein
MKKFLYKFLIVCSVIILFCTKLNAQFILKEADKQFGLYNYTTAVQLYTEAYQAKKTLHAAQRLAESYRLMRNYKQAESWYAIVQSMDGAKPDTFKWYAQMLQANAKFTEAKLAFEKYEALLSNATPNQLKQIDIWKASCDSAVVWMKNPKPISVFNEKTLNTPQSDFGAIAHNNAILFTSDRPLAQTKPNTTEKPFLKFDGLTKMPNTKTYGATGNAYLQIYQKGNEEDQISIFNLNIKSDYHVGTPSFSADGTEVFFTVTRVPEKVERIKKSPSTINVEIYSAKKLGGIWSEAIPFRYNKVQKWSVGDPFLTKDGNTLYFVSNMPGGLGGTDIYFCKRNANGDWEDAVNLTELNTAGNERSVAIADKHFYFSTDGLISMGGLDIYRARIKNGMIGNIENLGFPVNSPQDDFAFSLATAKKRFLSSNREGGLGDDDIYSYLDTEKLTIPFESQIFDNETKLPLANAVITLKQFNGKTIKVETDQNGKYKLPLDEDSDYSILVDKTNYMSTSKLFSTKGIDIDSTLKLDFVLNQIVIEKPIVLENIYYDFNKANIKPSSFKVLDSLVTMLKDNPTLWVELSSHTDAIGADAYNQWLSEMRAISAVRYIVRNGIDKSRINAKGYGETKPVEKCTTCTLRQNQLNRRTEFKIVKQ